MILSNNHATYISIAIQHRKYGTGIYLVAGISLKYIHRWTGPSAVHTSRLRSALWNKDDIKNYKESL